MKRRGIYVVLCFAILILSCKHREQQKTVPVEQEPVAFQKWIRQCTESDNLITEGRGFDRFVVDTTSPEQITTTLGKDFERKLYYTYSMEYRYEKLGLSFFFRQADTTRLMSIHFRAPFKGHTAKGVILGVTRMKDAIDIYGPPQWTTAKDSDKWRNEYEGILFMVDRDMSLPQFPFKEEVHAARTIVCFNVTNNSRTYVRPQR